MKNNITPKHFFLHVFAVIMLYFSTVNIITLLFQYINVLIPDALSRMNIYSAHKEIIRFSLSSIIIVFPFFILGSWLLHKNYKKNTDIRKMKIRKWLVYFTLFIGALIIVSSLVVTVFWLLRGEITLRFVLKTVSLLAVISTIFVYYIKDIKEERPSTHLKYWVGALSFFVFVVIITGFFIVGSPQNERLRQFDLRKIEDLNNIQWQIISYWQAKGELPENLSELQQRVPIDVQNNQPYEYILEGENSFTLCAEFNLPSESNLFDWQYNKGKDCFYKIIDKDLYPRIYGN